MDGFRRWMYATNGRAVTAVFLGAIGLLGFGVILGPIAAGLGLIALGELRRQAEPDRLARTTAIVGVLLGVAAFVLALVLAAT
jgi:apolipoprotein N-acyltransferase